MSRFDPAEQERPQGVRRLYGDGEVTPGDPTGKFLALFWTRVQDPSGTTNMDFELNQKLCDLTKTPTNCAPNGVTPIRTGDGPGPLNGDKLITYDLSKGGTVATISIRTWNGSAWGSPTVLTRKQCTGSRHRQHEPDHGGQLIPSLGALDPRTFGEASISFGALFGENAVRAVRLGLPQEPFIRLVHGRAEGLRPAAER